MLTFGSSMTVFDHENWKNVAGRNSRNLFFFSFISSTLFFLLWFLRCTKMDSSWYIFFTGLWRNLSFAANLYRLFMYFNNLFKTPELTTQSKNEIYHILHSPLSLFYPIPHLFTQPNHYLVTTVLIYICMPKQIYYLILLYSLY